MPRQAWRFRGRAGRIEPNRPGGGRVGIPFKFTWPLAANSEDFYVRQGAGGVAFNSKKAVL
jgi:hypothetical protein